VPHPDWLFSRQYATPNATALMVDGERMTYLDLHWKATLRGEWLRSAGIEAGDRVAVWLPNGAEYVYLIHAAARSGVTLVPLNTRLTAEEALWQVKRVGARAVVHAGGLPKGFNFDEEWLLDIRRDYQRRYTGLHPHFEPLRLKRVQGIMFSSGTTGQPKAIPLTFGNHYHSAMASAMRLGVMPGDQWLACMPLYHVGGQAIILRACLYGITVNLHPRFDVEAVNHAIENEGVTLVSMVPTMLHRLMEHRGDAPFPPSLRLVLLGGAAAPAPLIERCAAVGLPVAATYGLTEAASQVATATPQQVRAKPGTVGRPLFGTHLRIVNEHGIPLGAGQVGEIAVQGPTVMGGYLNDPDATAAALRDEWLHTGDLGYMDDDGDLWVVTRRTDLIVSGGENVYPAEVEDALEAHPDVAHACVVGVVDAEWGQRVAAQVVRRRGTLSADALVAFSRERLAGYKVPRHIVFTEELPRTASGKIKRDLVRQTMEKQDHVF
jgi:O-succinylbenzoic acid--CoA ligase